MTIGEELKKTRVEKGLSIRQLATKANVSNSYLSEIENDIKVPTLDFLSKINSALDFSLLGAIMAYYDGEREKKMDELINSEIERFGIKNIDKYKYQIKELKDALRKELSDTFLNITTGLPKGTGLRDWDKISK